MLDRREFLFYSTAVATGITLGELGRRQLARADERAGRWRDPGVETWATSVCRECPAACGVRVRLVDDIPVKLEGNPLCPISRGRLCAKGQAAIESYFDPDRLTGPARRLRGEGEPGWEPLSWDAAAELLASFLGPLQSEPGAILALAAEEEGPLAQAWATFWRRAGARVAWTRGHVAMRLGRQFTALTGATGCPVFDLDHATHVLSFGAPLVEDWLSAVWAQRAYGSFRRGGNRARGRLVQVDERHSLTARKADEWLPVPEERQASLAYGIASVLLRENRVDRSFLDEVGGNLQDFEHQIVERYPPDRAAELTGVPVVTLLRLARDLTATTHPLAVVGADAPPDLIEAVLALDALIGAFDRPGGILEASGSAQATEIDDATEAVRDLVNGRIHPRLVVLRDASPLRARTAPVEAAAAVAKCELVVSFSPYLDETSAVSHLLLPAPTALESWHGLRPPPADPREMLACARPAAPARLDTRDVLQVLKTVGDRIGGTPGTIGTWISSEECVRAEIDRLWNLRRGTPYTSAFETEWIAQLETGGWWVPPAASPEAFQAAVVEAGGWVDPFFAAGRIREALKARGGLTFGPPLAVEVSVAVGRAPLLGVAGRSREPSTGETDFPLRLATFTPAAVNLMGGPNQPVLFELLGQPENPPWRVWAEVNPETASELGLAPGSLVRIESAGGSVDALVRYTENMPADTVALAFVPAVPEGGRWARRSSSDARRLWAGADVTRSCAVRIRKA
jgi:anaerobic selenocysteine-containing dehydrogenase